MNDVRMNGLRKFCLFPLILLVIACLTPVTAEACTRCGLFGNKCRFVASHAQYVAPVVYPQAASVFVVQNSYPAPLVAQGQTIYQSAPASLQQALLPLFDLNRYAQQRIELKRADQQTAALDNAALNSMAIRFAELQAPAVERLAAGQAAQMVLQAAGLDTSASSQGSTQAVIISRENGKTVVQQMNFDQVQSLQAIRQLKQTQPAESPPPAPAPENGGSPLLQEFCGKCHGLDKAQPKGGFYLGDDTNVAKAMMAKWFSITTKVSGRTMPPEGEPQPTDTQRAAILNEIEKVIVKQTGGK